jgi:uncharacterized RDD family membrane protein YckC
MKIPARTLYLNVLAALFCASALIATAQENAPPPPAAPAAQEEPELRRLDVDAETPAENANAQSAESASEAAAAAPAADTPAAPPAAEPPPTPHRRNNHRHHSDNERVSFWHDSALAAHEQAEVLVSIFGSSTSEGSVNDSVVSVFGSSTSSGEVGNAVVSILGNSRVTGGRVGDAVVSVLGSTYVNAPVHGPAVAVLGNLELGPNAEVGQEVVCIGGTVTRDPASVVHGQINNVSFGPHFGGFEWLQTWVRECLLLGRPLAFAAGLAWAWWLAVGFLIFYVVLALLFPRAAEKCVATLEERPGYSVLTALLVTLLTPLAAIVLAVTIVGAPALVLFLFIAGLFGKMVMLAWLGRRITKHFEGPLAATAFAVLVGGIILLLLYTVPIVGFIVAKLTSWLGLGVVVYTIILGIKRSRAAVVAVAPKTPPTVPVTPVAPANSVPPPVVSLAGEMPASDTGAAVPPMPPPSAGEGAAVPPPLPTVMVSAATLPRAGFWIRIAASLLDLLLVALTTRLVPDHFQPNFLLLFAVYCCVLWALKGTTIGGIVCGLKVVRLDDRRVDWPTAIVRALGGFLSLVAAGIGFIWVAFDDQKQSWHDKIAGTTIVQVPKGVSLV